MQCRRYQTAISRILHKQNVLLPRPFTPRLQHRLFCATIISWDISHDEPRGTLRSTQHRRNTSTYRRQKDATQHGPDTIYALSTAPGRAAIAVVRISGPACLDIYGGLCPHKPFPHPRIATLRKLFHPTETDDSNREATLESQSPARILDHGALVLYFQGPNTVTGENVLELHVHGGPAVVRSVLEAIPQCSNTRPRRRSGEYSIIRPAEPGEFTKRAFYNGRLDLTQAEALGEVLAAETEQQRRLAIGGSESGLAKRYEEWRKMLLYARGELEALIDFSEDQHFDESPSEFMRSVTEQIVVLRRQIQLHIQNATRGELLRNGISIALLGAPNAGKSSLLNRIVGREAAIVSAEAGTTRDIVDVSVDIGGWLCRLGDMAGLRSPAISIQKSHVEDVSGMRTVLPNDDLIGVVEREGIRRARERALESDIVIILLSVHPSITNPGTFEISINDEVLDAARECISIGKTIVIVVNKIDLIEANLKDRSLQDFLQTIIESVLQSFPTVPVENMFAISCREASLASSMGQSIFPGSDPGGIQRFLSGLMAVMQSMTSAIVSTPESNYSPADGPISQPKPSSNTISTTPAEAQAYWSQSLSITHRQANYLRSCLDHLDDYLAISSPSTKYDLKLIGKTSSANNRQLFTKDRTLLQNNQYLVDGHDDIVAEIESSSSDDFQEISSASKVRQRSTPNLLSSQLSNFSSPLQPQLSTTNNTSITTIQANEEEDMDIVRAAEHLRFAADALSRITGRGESGDVEDVLGVVFEK